MQVQDAYKPGAHYLGGTCTLKNNIYVGNLKSQLSAYKYMYIKIDVEKLGCSTHLKNVLHKKKSRHAERAQ